MEAKSPKTSRLVKLQQVQAGLAKHFQPTSTLQVGGTSYTAHDLSVLIQGDLDVMQASAKAHADWRTLVQVERSSHDKVTPVLQLLEGLIVHMFGDTQEAMSVLSDFGFTPRKRTKPSVAKQAEAIGKTKATRKARNTLGPKQKAEIHGTPVTPPTPKA